MRVNWCATYDRTYDDILSGIPSKTSKFIPKWMKTYKIGKRELRDFADEFACARFVFEFLGIVGGIGASGAKQCPRTSARFSKYFKEI